MAITTTTISRAPGFGKSDVITQFEEAFTWLGWHGGTQTGIVTGIGTYSAGGDINASATYQDVRQTSTTGIGTGASFYITRSSGGTVDRVMVNRPGYGYTSGELVTISPEDIGGSANGAVGLGITVLIAGGASPIGYGSTNAFYDKDLSGTYPWGVARHTIQPNKKYGDTYRAIQVDTGGSTSGFSIRFSQGSAFHPWNDTNTSNYRNYYANRFAGTVTLDVPLYTIAASYLYNFDSGSLSNSHAHRNIGSFSISNAGSSYQLDLNIFRSGIDPNFAVFAYKQPTLSSTHLTSNSSSYAFIFHNFTTSLWNLDELFLGGLTTIYPEPGNTGAPSLKFACWYAANMYSSSSYYGCFRSAESGYDRSIDTDGRVYGGYSHYLEDAYFSNAYPQFKSITNKRTYYRSNLRDSVPVGANSDFNAVIKGIPLSTQMVPCPYYLPDDFVLIDFDYGAPAANIQQGDTITISGSEVYTVITGSYNQTTRTRGILFCARTV